MKKTIKVSLNSYERRIGWRALEQFAGVSNLFSKGKEGIRTWGDAFEVKVLQD